MSTEINNVKYMIVHETEDEVYYQKEKGNTINSVIVFLITIIAICVLLLFLTTE